MLTLLSSDSFWHICLRGSGLGSSPAKDKTLAKSCVSADTRDVLSVTAEHDKVTDAFCYSAKYRFETEHLFAMGQLLVGNIFQTAGSQQRCQQASWEERWEKKMTSYSRRSKVF